MEKASLVSLLSYCRKTYDMKCKKKKKKKNAYVLNVITMCHYNSWFSPNEMEDMEVKASLRVENDNAGAVTQHPCDVI